MDYIICFIIAFIIIYLFYFLTVILQKKRYDKFKTSNQVMYFVNRYKLDVDKINIKKFINIISLSNSFIIAFSFACIIKIENSILMLLVGVLILMPLMLFIYHLIGKSFQKEEK